MQRALMIVITAGIAGTSYAQPLTGLVKWEASGDGGATWQSYLPLTPGSPYKVRALASWTDGATPSVGFAGAAFEQIDLVGAGPGDTFDMAGSYSLQQVAPEVWTVQAGTGASAGFMKIDNMDPVRRCIFVQNAKIVPGGIPNPDFSGANPILIFEMDAIADANPSGKLVTISGTWNRQGTPAANFFRIYTTDTGSNKQPAQEATQMSVTIDTIIPAPGGLALLVPAGLMLGRRRR